MRFCRSWIAGSGELVATCVFTPWIFPRARGSSRKKRSYRSKELRRDPSSKPASHLRPASAMVISMTADSLRVAEGFTVGCVLPLVSRGRIHGVLNLARRGENAFSRDEVEFLMQVANQTAIAVENALAYRQIAELKDKLAQEKLYLEDEIRSEMNFEEIIGKSAVLRRVLKEVETVGPTESTVLIYGETGTGKELIARALHDLSPRRSSAFVKLNCAAIPTGLLESELFGHEKGSVYRRDRAAHRPFRAGQQWHRFSGRDR